MTLEQVKAEIAKLLNQLAATPANMSPALLDRLARLNGQREALWVMEDLPPEVRSQAARDNITSLTANSGNLRGAEVASTLAALAVYGTFAKMP